MLGLALAVCDIDVGGANAVRHEWCVGVNAADFYVAGAVDAGKVSGIR